MTSSQQLRRVVVVNDASFAKGGATGLAIASAEALADRGLEIVFLTGDDGAALRLMRPDFEVVSLGQQRMGSQPLANSFASGLYNRKAQQMVGRWIATHDRPDTVYHLHGWAQILSPSVFRALEKVQDRLVLSAHDFFLTCPNGAYALLKSGTLCTHRPMSLGCVTADCDRRHYVHKAWRVARQMVREALFSFRRHHPPVLIIHEAMRPILCLGGIEASSMTTVPNPVQPFLTARCEAEHNSAFLFVGRFEDGKGPDLAAAAARRAGVPLIMVGDGPMSERLRSDYPEVTFTGRLGGEALASVARKARALLMPSRYPEPFGLVAAEALWSGLPVILAETAFLAPDITRGAVGLACNPRDVEGFANQIRLLGDDARVAEMSRRAFSGAGQVGQPFETWVDQLVGVYLERLTVQHSNRAA